MKNPYRNRTHFDVRKTRLIIRYFCEDLTATHTSKLLWIRRSTINDRYEYFRKTILRESIKTDKEIWNWIIEIDESYFWPRRIRWKRWRWAWWKTIVLWLLKREWKVYVQIVPDCSTKSLIPIIRGKVDPEKSIVNTDGWKTYDGLIDLWYEKHYRVHHWINEFARWKQHINWIESFRSYTKRRLTKFNGVQSDKFMLHLKECEFRFNCRLEWENMYSKLLQILKKYSKAF